MFYILRREISGPVGIPGTPDYRLFGGDSDTLRASLIVQLVKNRLQCRRPPFDSWVGKIPWRRDRLPTPEFLGFPRGSAGKESAFNVGDLGSIPGLGRFPGEGKGYSLQYSGPENSMDSIVHGCAKNQTQLSDFHFHFKLRRIKTLLPSLHWRRQWHPTPVLLPGKSHGWRSLVGCSPWGR